MPYVDHAATTPCRKEVWDAMCPYFLEEFANPNSIHAAGRKARRGMNEARQIIAQLLCAREKEIIFTSGGSEANNLALRGVARVASKGCLVATKIEHHSILHTLADFEQEGFEVTYLPVDKFGRVTPEQVAAVVRTDTILVSIMHANNEIGTIQPISDIVRAVKEKNPNTLVHTDAVQSVGHIEVDVERLGVDLLSFTAHKFYGPKGVGVLYIREGVKLISQITGGGQEKGLRSGTQSVPLIVGMAQALKFACEEMAEEKNHWSLIRDQLIEGLLAIEGSRLNGHASERLPNNVNVSFLGLNGEDLTLLLSQRGVYVSTGSACTTGSLDPSHVLTALGLTRAWAIGSLRLTLGNAARDIDPDQIVREVRSAVEELRSTHTWRR